jgi:hypothetical protein
VLGAHAPLEFPLLLEPALALSEALAAVARDRLGPRCTLGLERLLGLAQPLAPIAARAQTLGQLVAASP